MIHIHPYGWFGYISGFIVVGVCVWFAWNAPNRVLDVAVILLGLCIGWGIGILASPDTGAQAGLFNQYGKIISGFLTGFLVAKKTKCGRP